ncbi:MAG: NUDIX domain-containing protein [Pirellulales bacterium]|jgi:8-oxo-dGTP diphosphatase/A/G-specific adenine glycosylase
MTEHEDAGTEVIAVAVAVVCRGDHVLVGWRAADAADAAGLAEFPGGKHLPGEDAATTAARECLEETGLTIRVEGVIGRARTAARRGAVAIAFVTATAVEPAPSPKPPFRWVRRGDLAELRFPDANAAVLAWLREAAADRASVDGTAG